MATDFYPQGLDARAAWHINFAKEIIGLAAKYNISPAVLLEIAADAAWIEYWAQARNQADAQRQQLTQYINTISGKDEQAPAPAPIDWELSVPVPPEVPPGMEFRVREIARQIKGSMVYAVADGELLGIVSSGGTASPLSPGQNVAPDYTLVTLADFALQATFKKLGNNAVKFQYRRKGGNWADAGVLITSPGSFHVAPLVPGVAEQIEVRAIYLLGNVEVGVFSDAKPAFIAP